MGESRETASDGGPPTTPDDSIKRDSGIWFEDGNVVVVVAQNTAFRFHKSVLSLHSPMFRDLFSVPQPSEPPAVETLDGCLVVRVSDTRYDFRELLRAIYGGVSHLHPDKAVTFTVLTALARLSHKYQLDQLLEVIHRLKGTFTTELKVRDKSDGFDGSPPLELYSHHAIEALNLFRLLNRPEMIPVALYQCCQLEVTELIHGVTRDDGVSRECLSPAYLELCLEARQTLVRETVCLTMKLGDTFEARITQISSDQGCTSPAVCVEGLNTLLSPYWHSLQDYIDEDPLDTFYSTRVNDWVCLRRICSTCGDAMETVHANLRKGVWDKLPGLWGMDIVGWDFP